MTHAKMVATYSKRQFCRRKDVSFLAGSLPLSIARHRYQVHVSINNASWPTDRCFFHASMEVDKGERTEKIAHLRHQNGIIGFRLFQRLDQTLATRQYLENANTIVHVPTYAK